MWIPGETSSPDVLPFLDVDATDVDPGPLARSMTLPDMPLLARAQMFGIPNADMFTSKTGIAADLVAHPLFGAHKLPLPENSIPARIGSTFSSGAVELPGISCLNVAESYSHPHATVQPPACISPKSSSVCSDEEGLDASGSKRQKGGKTRGALAQKRFRERQKERLENCQKRVRELSDEVKRLKQEKEQLVTHLQVVDIVVQLHIQHHGEIQADEEILEKAQWILLDELAKFLSPVIGDNTLTGQQLGRMCLAQYTQEIFPQYISALRQLLAAAPTAAQAIGTPAGTLPQVKDVMMARTRMENRRALFSCSYWALACWNGQHANVTIQLPSADMLLRDLQLKADQEQALLRCHETLLSGLTCVAQEWRQILPTLALELLQVDKGHWHECPAVKSLTRNLCQERELVLSFLHRALFQVLDLKQLAVLEVSSYPWAPDMCQVCLQLAAKHGCKADHEKNPLPWLTLGFASLMSLMPHQTAYQVLLQPMLAHGAGLWMKWALVLDPFITVLPRNAYPKLTPEKLQESTMLSIGKGAYLKTQHHWLQCHQPTYASLLPQLGGQPLLELENLMT